MDTPSQQPPVFLCQCRYCRRGRWGIIGGFFRLIGLLVLLALVFAAGLLIGSTGPKGLLSLDRGLSWNKDVVMGPGMMVSRNGAATFDVAFGSGDRVFGVVTSVNGQKITIADNGGGTQTFTATAQTTVVDGQKEVAVWSLRRGNSVRVSGDEEDGAMTARIIEIIR